MMQPAPLTLRQIAARFVADALTRRAAVNTMFALTPMHFITRADAEQHIAAHLTGMGFSAPEVAASLPRLLRKLRKYHRRMIARASSRKPAGEPLSGNTGTDA